MAKPEQVDQPEAGENPAAPGAAAKPRGLVALLLGAIALVFPAAVGVGLGIFAFPPLNPTQALERSAERKKAEAAESKTELHTLEPIVVNLGGTGGQRFLKVTIAFEWRAKLPEQMPDLLARKTVILRDRTIALLGAKTIKAIDSPNGKTLVKKEIQEVFDRVLFPKGAGKVGRIFFAEFIIQ